jgi:hypothetical protein
MRVVWLAILGLSALPAVAAAQPPGDGGPVAAERVTIAFERGTYSVVSRTTLTKVLAPSDALPEGPGPFTGCWFELRAADGTIRYRRVIDDPVLLVSETAAAAGDAGAAPGAQRLVRAATVPDHRIFSVLVPAARDGDELLLFGPPYAPDARGVMAAPALPTASLEVARLALPPAR